MNELKKCPFCGNKAIVETGLEDGSWSAHCTTDTCIAFDIMPSYRYKEAAVEAWNNRHTPWTHASSPPPEDDWYLATVRTKDEYMVLEEEFVAGRWLAFGECEVIAWMPIPEPWIPIPRLRKGDSDDT